MDKRIDRINYILETISKSPEVPSMVIAMTKNLIYKLKDDQLEELYEIVLFHGV